MKYGQYKKILFLLSLSVTSYAFNTPETLAVQNVQGKFEARVLDFKDHAELQYLLHGNDGQLYELKISGTLPKRLKTGDEVRLQKASKQTISTHLSKLTLTSDTITIIQSALDIPAAFGPQRILVFLANFEDDPGNIPWSVRDIEEAFFSTLNNMVAEYSYHKASVEGTVVGWYNVPVSSQADCGALTSTIYQTVLQRAMDDGIDLTQYQRYFFLFPPANCPWAGAGSGGGNPSISWVNGTNSLAVIGHELGHNLGIGHARLLKCSDSPNTGTCSTSEYGDQADIMGRGGTAHFNALHKDRLGYLNSATEGTPPIEMVTTSGTYTIAPYERDVQEVKALKIFKGNLPDNKKEYYYLEFRQGIGFDAHLAECEDCDFTKGVLIHQGDGNPFDFNPSNLLDMSTGDDNARQVALLPGQTFTDEKADGGKISIQVVSISEAGALVNIQFGVEPPPPPPSSKCNSPTQIKYTVAADKSAVTLTWEPPTKAEPILKYEVDRPEGTVLWVGENAMQRSFTDHSVAGSRGSFVYHFYSLCADGKSKGVKRTVVIK